MDAFILTCATCRTKNRVPFTAADAPTCSQCGAYLPWIAHAVDLDFDAIANSQRVVVCVDLGASWVTPSRIVSPLLERVASERAGRLKLVKVSVEDARHVQSRLKARMIPTLLLFWQGTELGRHEGALELPALRRWVDHGLATALRAGRTPSDGAVHPGGSTA